MQVFDVEEVLKNMTLEEKAQFCSGRDFWKTQDVERLGIPSIMMCDGPNGLRKQLGEGDHLGINESIETVCYPTASAMASSFDRNVMSELGSMLGKECQSEDIGMLLGPGVNMKRSPLCGRNFEYLSEDPYLAGALATAYIQGLQGEGIAACVKHFAANNQETRRMSGTSQVDERTLHEIYLPAFEMAVKKGKVRSVMCAYNAVNDVFCAENQELLTDILREEWGFDGMVVTDWGAVKDRVKGLEAGVDLEMPGSTEGKAEAIVDAVKSGALEERVLDTAVRNNLKFVRDCLENRMAERQNGNEESDHSSGNGFDREAAHRKAGDFAKECAVLLKNDGMLPLQETQKVVFIGEFAENPRFQGSGSSHIHVRRPVSPLDAIDGQNITYAKGYSLDDTGNDADSLLAEAVETARDADAAVVFAGLPDAYETEGCDRDNIDLPENQNRLISEVTKVQKNVTVVLFGGSCMALPWVSEVNGLLCMYLGGDHVGQAAVDLLYGRANPSGHLAETWPLKVEDNPSWLNFPGEDGVVEYREGIYIGYRYYDKKKMDVLFPFGHGLSYTSFAYKDFKLSRESMSDTDTVTVSCIIKNVGTCAGKEAVQLYVGVPDSDVRRPVRELKGFEKIYLEPGEEKEVSFLLDGRSFAYYESKIHDWFTESRPAVIEIGASSRDIRLSGSVKIQSAQELPLHVSLSTTIGELMRIRKGREFVANLMTGMGMGAEGAGVGSGTSEGTEDAMGAGGEKMRRQMMFEMPLSALAAYGVMSPEALKGLVESLNE
ncbi:MAG: glycoside hydrolase family 3 C-terminal domain-containing protein [Clostridiales bacterium]|nr:glycoside hydrolase family 3 C-terminal domain-containing protein [Clostridiales bacterium]